MLSSRVKVAVGKIGRQAAGHRDGEEGPHGQRRLDGAAPDQDRVPDGDEQVDQQHRDDGKISQR